MWSDVGKKMSGDSKEAAKMCPGVGQKVSGDSKEAAKMWPCVGQKKVSGDS